MSVKLVPNLDRLVTSSPGDSGFDSAGARGDRFVGIDIGAETIKVIEMVREGGALHPGRRTIVEHGKNPGPVLLEILGDWDWPDVEATAVTGRFSRQINLPRVPTKQAQVRGCRFLFGADPATVISIGSHGFSVLELRVGGVEVFRENSRCSQGTGNFLRQLVERFSLTIEEASELCADVKNATPLSGRCPVILKTDMTHLANKGEDRARILAGLFDAVCENVLVLVKSGVSPKRVVLLGGVTRARRVQRLFGEALARRGMTLLPLNGDDALFLEAMGCALVAAERPAEVPPLTDLLLRPPETRLERVSALTDHLGLVRRMLPPPHIVKNGRPFDLILGFDIGSTGSKLVALEAGAQEILWEGYRQTLGDPVGAAQALLRQFVEADGGLNRVRALGVTGSGREIVGSLMSTCYGADVVFVLNEIAAHATGALHYDPRVDTIFEIGGQDAKYIRLAEGKVIDCAMNEACSAGTGSFIEEQGRKFADIRDVVDLGREALQASYGVSLGQHCSVFMAEVIDESVAAGVESRAIIAGLYDSIIQNYLHRVKGNRSVGQVIFCQGMPFSSDALAAAVARQSQSQVVIPPNPGTVGALGIALLARRELRWEQRPALDPRRFLEARLEKKEAFVCKANVGCGGAGNKCRIDTISTVVAQQRQRFNWGGACALYDKGTRKKKLPDLSPDPFREREALADALKARLGARRGAPVVALSDEFMLKGLLPFFATFLHELGFDLAFSSVADQATLRRGIQGTNVPFCAPMQLFHGTTSQMAAGPGDHYFVPMIRAIPRTAGEADAVTCPIVQASPHILRWDLKSVAGHDERGLVDEGHSSTGAGGNGGDGFGKKLLSPIINVGDGNLESGEFLSSCQRLADSLGVRDQRWRQGHRAGVEAQVNFEQRCLEIGRRALDFCAQRGVTPVVVLGRPYTIYNSVLNSNVPPLLREQGALAIPVDCYPLEAETPIFHDMFWGYAQRILRAAHQIRRTPGVYSVYCSNYSCGPDSFNLHFYAYLMEGKPFAVVETDGHAGDAGTKTRMEAFLYCVEQDQKETNRQPKPNDFERIRVSDAALANVRRDEERVLIPLLGPAPAAFAACLRGLGIQAECLPFADAEALRLGRRYTSGKECLPMCMTLGLLLQRVNQAKASRQRFVFGMPSCRGPCRFGVYNLLNRIALERLGWADRVRIWSPQDSNYFEGLPPGFSTLVFSGFMAADLLQAALLDVRPGEKVPGASNRVYERYSARLLELLEEEARGDLSVPNAIWQVACGRLFGVTNLLAAAAAEFAQRRERWDMPTVLMVGEIYARCNEFANDFLIEKLEQRGVRVRLAPFTEWLEYADCLARRDGRLRGLTDGLKSFLQARIRRITHATVARPLGWPPRVPVTDTVAAAARYVPGDLRGEAVLTLGGPLHEWHDGQIDAVVNAGPHECMPSKIAEAQFFHAAEEQKLLSLTLPLNGDPIDPEVLDNFVFEVHCRYRKRLATRRAPSFVFDHCLESG